MRSKPQSPHFNSGFSLTELLVVMAIIAVITAASMPMLSGILRGGHVSQALQQIGGTMERARQTAIAQNTYVWVVFSDADSGDQDSTPSMALVSSKTGLDSLAWNSAPLDLTTQPDLEFLDKPIQLNGVKVGEIQTLGEELNWSLQQSGKSRLYSKAIQFTPTGDAKLKTMKPEIAFSVSPSRGDEKNTAIVSTKTITGKTKVSRVN